MSSFENLKRSAYARTVREEFEGIVKLTSSNSKFSVSEDVDLKVISLACLCVVI